MKILLPILIVSALGLAAVRLAKSPPPQNPGRRVAVLSRAESIRLAAYDEARREGRAAFERGDLATAEARYTEALRLCPEIEFTLKDLAEVYEREGRGQDAYDTYHKILRERPEIRSSLQADPRLLARYGELCEANGSVLEARWAYARAAAAGVDGLPPAGIVPRDDGLAALKAAAFGKAGTTAAAHGKTTDAVAYLRKAALADPRSWPVQYQLGVALGNLGKRVEGEAALRKAERMAERTPPSSEVTKHAPKVPKYSGFFPCRRAGCLSSPEPNASLALMPLSNEGDCPASFVNPVDSVSE